MEEKEEAKAKSEIRARGAEPRVRVLYLVLTTFVGVAKRDKTADFVTSNLQKQHEKGSRPLPRAEVVKAAALLQLLRPASLPARSLLRLRST